MAAKAKSPGYQTSLLTAYDHKEAFKRIKNFLAGRLIGATRERAMLEEVLKCLFCKSYIQSHASLPITHEDPLELSKQYREIFAELKKRLPFVFEKDEEMQLDPVSIHFIDSAFQDINVLDTERDIFGDLYEVFVGTGIREEEGQFFTPQNGVELLVSLVNPQPGERVIDPATGAGGFLSATINHLVRGGIAISAATSCVYGVEKDSYLAKLTSTRLSVRSLEPSNVHCGDSLAWEAQNGNTVPIDGLFDVVLTNPPFGKNIVSTNKTVQKDYELGFDWKINAKTGQYERNGKLSVNVPPQVLFVEKSLNLLKEGGRLGIVLPESLLTSKSYSYVIQYMRERGEFHAVLGMPEDFFKTSGKGGTHTKACLVFFTKNTAAGNRNKLFMAEAKWCGHDSRGRKIENDDLPLILKNYHAYTQGKSFVQGHLGYTVDEAIIEDNILSPRYYNPDIKGALFSMENTHDVIPFGDLVNSGVIEVKTGNEVGKMAYGTGEIPFVRTSDISNWEVKIDPKHGVSKEIHALTAKKQDVRENDILMVKDGTYLIGTCAIISKYDTIIVYQSHLYKIRVLKPEIITPHLLLAILSSDPVQRQIKAKRFTQDIIDSLGSRIYELILPIPKDQGLRARIEGNVKKAVEDRIEARELARLACLEVAGVLAE